MSDTNFDTVVARNLNANDTLHFFISGGQSTGTKKGAALIGLAGTIVDVRANLATPPAGSSFLVDVNKNGTTLYGTTHTNQPTIVAAANASSSVLPDTVAVAAGDVLSFDIDQVGSGTAGSDLTVSITIKRGTTT